MKGFSFLCAWALALSASAVERMTFVAEPMTAGKAALVGSGFRYSLALGTANFSPDLRYPLQLVYDSSSEKAGIAGFGWSCPAMRPQTLGCKMERALKGDAPSAWQLYLLFSRLNRPVWANRFLYMSALEGHRLALSTIESRVREDSAFLNDIFVKQPKEYPTMDEEVALAYRPPLLPYYWLAMNYNQRGDHRSLQAMRSRLKEQGLSQELMDNHLVVEGNEITLVTPFQKTKDYLKKEFQTPEEEKRVRELQSEAMHGNGKCPYPSPAGELIDYYRSWWGRKDDRLAAFWGYINDLYVKRSTQECGWDTEPPAYDPALPFIETQRETILANLAQAETPDIYALYVRDLQIGKEKDAMKLLPILRRRGVSPYLLKARMVIDTHGKRQIMPMPGMEPISLEEYRGAVTDLKEEVRRALSGDETASYRLFWHYDGLPGAKKMADQWLYLGGLSAKASIWPDVERRLRERDVPLEGLFDISDKFRRQYERMAESGSVDLWPSFLMYRYYDRQNEKNKAAFWWRKMTDSIKHIDQNVLRQLKRRANGQLEIDKEASDSFNENF